MRRLARHLPPGPLRVVEVGSAEVGGGSYRELLGARGAPYVGLDLRAGPGVDIVLDSPHAFPLPDGSADAVLSGQALEHAPRFWRVLEEVARVLRPGGLLLLVVPSAGPIHRHPVDCYRFLPDCLPGLAEDCGLDLVESWLDETGPWCDLSAAFRKPL